MVSRRQWKQILNIGPSSALILADFLQQVCQGNVISKYDQIEKVLILADFLQQVCQGNVISKYDQIQKVAFCSIWMIMMIVLY
jgi:hypothetical protein